MAEIDSYIFGGQKLIDVHGRWPTFHDAEVIEINFWRGQIAPGEWDDANVFPVLTAKIHVFVESPDSRHTLATLRFEDVDDFRMEGFNHQNAILGMKLRAESESIPAPLFVEFQPAFGMSASFRCSRLLVLEAVLCTEEGRASV